MKKETKTLLEYRSPKCVEINAKAQSVLCSSPLFSTDGNIDYADEEDLGTL